MSWIYAVVYLLFFTGILVPTEVSSALSSACEPESAELKCGPREIIALRGVEYAVRSQRKRPCAYQDGDCRYRVNSDVPQLNSLCSGKPQCPIQQTRLNASAKSQACPGTPLYRNVHYDCVPELGLAQMCTNVTKTGDVLYLSNDKYPDLIDHGAVDCTCVLTSAQDSEIAVNVIELALAGDQRMAANKIYQQSLSINDSITSSIFSFSQQLGFYGYREVFKGGSHVDIHLTSRTPRNEGRFFLELKAKESPVTVECYGGSATPTHVQSRSPDDPSDHPSDPSDNPPQQTSGVNLAVIGGIVAATVVSIGGVILVICLIRRRRRELHRKSSDRQMDIRDGVVDPFIVTADSHQEAPDNQNGTNTFRPRKISSGPAPCVPAPPIPQEDPVGVYSTAGYSAPWDSRAQATPPATVYHNQQPSHYTYIAPDILHHVSPKKVPVSVPVSAPERPKPAVRMMTMGHQNGKEYTNEERTRHIVPSAPEINANEVNGEDAIFVDNSLYQSGYP